MWRVVDNGIANRRRLPLYQHASSSAARYCPDEMLLVERDSIPDDAFLCVVELVSQLPPKVMIFGGEEGRGGPKSNRVR